MNNTNTPPELNDQLRKYQVDTARFAKYYGLLHESSPDVALVATAALLVLLRGQHHGMTIVLDIMRKSYDDSGGGAALEWNIPAALELIPHCTPLATELGLASPTELSTTLVAPLARHLRTAVETFTTFLHQHYCKSRLPRKYLIVTWQLAVLLRKEPTAFGLTPDDDPLATAMVYIQHHVSCSTEPIPVVDSINSKLGPDKGLSIPNLYMAATSESHEILDWACLAVDDTLFYVETMCDSNITEEQQPLSKKARTIVPVLYGDAMELHEWVVRLASASPVRPKGTVAELLLSLLPPLVGNKAIMIQPDGKILISKPDGQSPETEPPTDALLLQSRTSALSDTTVLQMIVTVLHEHIEGKMPLPTPVHERMRSYIAVATFVVHTATSTNHRSSSSTNSTTAATLLERIWAATECKSPRAFLAIPPFPRWPRILRRALAAAHDAILDSHIWDKKTGDFYEHISIATTMTTTGRRKKDAVTAATWPPPVLLEENDASAGSVLVVKNDNDTNDRIITWPAPCHNAIAIQLLAMIKRRVEELLRVLQVVDVAITPIMGLVRYTLRHHIEFMWDRHIDHLILVCIYGVGRSCESQTLTFSRITEGYVRCRQSVLGESTCQRIARHVRLESGDETGSVIHLYNAVFVPAVQDYLLDETKFTKYKNKL